MRSDKMKRMMDAYDGFKGYQTVKHVQSQIPAELFAKLTGREIGLVMSAVNQAYHNGKASLMGLAVCDDCVWIPWGGGKFIPEEHLSGSVIPKTGECGQLIPIDALRNIKIEGKKYTLDFAEN